MVLWKGSGRDPLDIGCFIHSLLVHQSLNKNLLWFGHCNPQAYGDQEEQFWFFRYTPISWEDSMQMNDDHM